MPHLSEPSSLPPGPSPVKVPQRGVSGRLAAVIVVGAIALVAGVALLDRSSARPPGPPAALERPTATFEVKVTPEPGPGWFSRPVERVPGQRSLATGGTPLPDVAGALAGDEGGPPLPLGTIDDVPDDPRLDFLFELCNDTCFRDAHWLDPGGTGLGSGTWTVGAPFHVREGFINSREEPLGTGFDVVLYVTRLDGATHEPAPTTYRFEPDYVARGTSDRCGPTYESQAGPATCEWFVHDFPTGLPEGRWAIWAVWEAPCAAWADLGLADSCADSDEVISLFASGFDAPYERSEPSYGEVSAHVAASPAWPGLR